VLIVTLERIFVTYTRDSSYSCRFFAFN